jgi:hypothetical protein
MAQAFDLTTSRDDNQLPVAKMAKLLVRQAVEANADCVIFELELEAHKKITAEKAEPNKDPQAGAERFPGAFQIFLKIKEVEKQLPPAGGYLFEPVTRILLNAVEIPYWTKDEVSAKLETSNPSSKWIIESKNLTQRIQLRRIRAA